MIITIIYDDGQFTYVRALFLNLFRFLREASPLAASARGESATRFLKEARQR
jgi:hypothetical protein